MVHQAILVLHSIHCIQAAPRATSSALPSNKTGPSNSATMMEVEFEFSDTAGLTCLLCSRQFKSLDQLKRHNKESDLHKARHFSAVYLLKFFGLTLSFVLFACSVVPFFSSRKISRIQIFVRSPDRK